jgi:hypothetical protein
MAWKRIHADVPATQILEADPDIAKPLYFWQLVSLIGTELMFDIVNKFYTRVYEDREDPTFVAAFTRIAKKEHHIETQIQLWVDAMGAGSLWASPCHNDVWRNALCPHSTSLCLNPPGAKRTPEPCHVCFFGVTPKKCAFFGFTSFHT